MDLTVAPAPRFTALEAARLARDRFGLDGDLSPLPSERDQNFLIGAGGEPRGVLKIANPSESEDVLDLQTCAIEHLARHAPTLAVPRVLRARTGSALIATAGADGRTFFVRALSYVPGATLAEVQPHSRDLLRSLGARLGDMDRALASFSHRAMRRELQWDLQHTARLAPFIRLVDPSQRPFVEDVVARFREDVARRLCTLRTGVIHNDWNDHNVLVATAPGDDPLVIGAIDFGDLLHSHTVCDLAIALTYAMLGKPDPVGAAAEVVRGYHGIHPLTEAEVEILFDLVRCRLATSVVMAARQRAAAPGNAYLAISQAPVRALLERLEAVPPAWIRYALREAAGLTPCPKGVAVTRWLEDRRDAIGPVLSRDLTKEPFAVLDLSVGGRADLRRYAAGATIGIGRYNEPRLVYHSERFECPGNDGPLARTLHIGLDFFTAAGTAVLAPLDGVVHSFRDNAAPLDYGPTVILEHPLNGGDSFFTLYGHLSVESLEGMFKGRPIHRGEQIGTIGDASVNGGWPPHLHLQIVADMLDRDGEFPGVARADERAVWLSLCPDPNLIARLQHPHLTMPRIDTGDLLDRRAGQVGPSLSVSYRRPLTILRGRKQYLYDQEGRAYLDAVNNVPHVGHGHPRVVKAGQAQMAILNTNTRYLHPLLTEYAARLAATLPPPLGVCFFVNSGSEANELALRIARAHTTARDVIVVDGAYHGNTSALVDISPYKFNGPGGTGRPDFVQVACMPDTYRGPHRASDPRAGISYAADVGHAIDRIRSAGRALAAFFCESLLSCGGQIVLPDGYLAEAYRLVREAGGVCVADEVQVGLGRVGTHFWGFETQGVVPDIVVLGKPMGNGHPLGAVVTTPALARSFANGMEFFSTFGGNPVSCAIGLAVLDVIRDERLQEHALRVGTRLLAGLETLKRSQALVGDVRGRGLFVGVELVEDRETQAPAARQAAYVINRMRDRGVLVSTDGPLHNVIKIKPPLVFSEGDADRLVETLDGVLHENGARLH